MNYREGMEIDIIDLLHVILSKWRVIFVSMLIGAIVLGAGSYFMAGMEGKNATEKNTVITNDELDKMRLKLTDKEVEEVLLSVESFLVNKEKYEDTLKHYKESLRYKVDVENAPNMKATFMISDYAEDAQVYMSEVTTVDNIVSLYASFLTSAPVIQEIRDITGYDVNETFIKELYSVEKDGLSMMEVWVGAPSKEECEAIMKILEKNLDQYKTTVVSANRHKIQKISENYYEQLDSVLRDEKSAEEQSLIDYQKSLLTVPTTFTTYQKEYYEALTDIYENRLTLDSVDAERAVIEDSQEEMRQSTSVEQNAEGGDATDVLSNQRNSVVTVKRQVSKKNVVLGGIAGAFLAVLWIAVCYVLSGALKTEADLLDVYGLSVFGNIRTNENDKKRLFSGIDNFIEKQFAKDKPVFSEDESMDIVCSGISAIAKKLNVQKLFITGVGVDDQSESYKDRIAKTLTAGKYLPEECKASHGKNVVYDPRALEDMVKSDGVVLVEKIGSSRYTNIAGELDAIRKYGVDVLGVVVLK